MYFIGTCLFFQSDGKYYAIQEEPFRIIGVCCKKKRGGAGGLSICRLLLYFTSLLIPTPYSDDSSWEFSTYVSYDKHITELILPFVLLNVTNIEGNDYTMYKI